MVGDIWGLFLESESLLSHVEGWLSPDRSLISHSVCHPPRFRVTIFCAGAATPQVQRIHILLETSRTLDSASQVCGLGLGSSVASLLV